MPNAWLDHVKKVKSSMPEGTLFKEVLKEAKKTWNKGTDAVKSAAKRAKKTFKSVVSKGGAKKSKRKTSKKSKRKSSKKSKRRGRKSRRGRK